MKASKNQIISGVISFAENELIPKVEDKPIKILFATTVLLIKANYSAADPLFENRIVKTLLSPDAEGLYDMDVLFSALEDSVRTYGGFPLKLPSVPVLSPDEKVLTLDASDVAEIKRRIADARA